MADKNQAERVELAASRFIAQRETGPWSAEDAADLQVWLSEATLHRVAYYRLNAAWQEAGRLKALNAGSAIDATPPAIAKWKWTERLIVRALAACVVLGVGTALFVFRPNLFYPDRYSTAVGGLETVPMSDGSRIVLNTDSAVRISLSKVERRIDLDKGEAYFEVAKDINRPFVVRAGDKLIVAVGTRFSVLRDGSDVRISVTEGAVRYEELSQGTAETRANAGKRKTVLLAAGTMARTESGNVLLRNSPVPEIEQHLTWRSGILTFHDTPLKEAVAEINRYNTRKIVILDTAVEGLQVGGIFGATMLDPFIHLLESGFPVRVREEGEQIILTSR